MVSEFDEFFSNAASEPVSKLEPYAALIRQCRRRHWSFRRIAAELKKQKQISVAPSTIWHFLQSQTPVAVANHPAKSPSPPPPAELPLAPQQPPPESAPATSAPRKPRFNLDI